MTSARAETAERLRHYTRDRPLLLWTEFAPDFPGGGAVIIRNLVALVTGGDAEQILWASPAVDTRKSGRRVVRVVIPGAGRRPSVFLDSTVRARALASETLRLARENGARGIWIVLHGSGVPVAAELVARAELPVHVTVHDDPAFGVALRSRRYLVLVPWIDRCLARALSGAASVDVISDGMRARYERRYGARAFVVHRGLQERATPSPPFDARAGLRIGVLGNTYSYAQVRVLAICGGESRESSRSARDAGLRREGKRGAAEERLPTW